MAYRVDTATEIDDLLAPAGSKTGSVHCANCIHCKLVPSPAEGEGSYYLRVRCDAGKWRKKLGEEKIYKYFTVARRSIASCDHYEDMGDSGDFLRDLRTTLPDRDELYSK
ncbi:MAG: hypothetical protein NT080_03720 [Spirochaetes bacterium]|nr:hypothetical protein [Spirochaetota bacterium]